MAESDGLPDVRAEVSRAGKTLQGDTYKVEVEATCGPQFLRMFFAWQRQLPEEHDWRKKSALRKANWAWRDKQGRRWYIEHGHDWDRWVLFGPDGDPFGDVSLASTIPVSLQQASTYIARRAAQEDLEKEQA